MLSVSRARARAARTSSAEHPKSSEQPWSEYSSQTESMTVKRSKSPSLSAPTNGSKCRLPSAQDHSSIADRVTRNGPRISGSTASASTEVHQNAYTRSPSRPEQAARLRDLRWRIGEGLDHNQPPLHPGLDALLAKEQCHEQTPPGRSEEHT